MGLIFAQLTIEAATLATPVLRGDANGDNTVTLPDAITILNFGFIPGSADPLCFAAYDVDGDGSFAALLDALFLLNFLFLSGTEPSAPFPDCGEDATGVATLGCTTLTCP